MSKRVVVVLSILIVAGLLMGGCGGGGQSTPQGAVEAYMKAFERGDAKALFKLVDPEVTKELEAYGGEQFFIMMMSEFLKEVDLVSYKINNVEQVGSDRAVAEITVKIRWYGDSVEEETDRIDLVKRGGKWYIVDLF